MTLSQYTALIRQVPVRHWIADFAAFIGIAALFIAAIVVLT